MSGRRSWLTKQPKATLKSVAQGKLTMPHLQATPNLKNSSMLVHVRRSIPVALLTMITVLPSGCQWKLDNITKLTRGQRAALPIHKAASVSPPEVVLDQQQSTETYPSQVQSPPPESIVLHALELLREGANSTNDDKGSVVKGSLRTFSKESVRVFETMCTLAVEAENVRKEKAWLSITKAVLWNSRPREELLRMGACMMDVSDFSTVISFHQIVTSFQV